MAPYRRLFFSLLGPVRGGSVNPLNPGNNVFIYIYISWEGTIVSGSQKPNYESCHHSYGHVLTVVTVAGCQVLCLWVPQRILGRHTRSGYRLLKNSREMPVPANPSPSLHHPGCVCFLLYYLFLAWPRATLLTISCCLCLPAGYHPLMESMCAVLQAVSCTTSNSTVKHWRCRCSKPAVDVQWLKG